MLSAGGDRRLRQKAQTKPDLGKSVRIHPTCCLGFCCSQQTLSNSGKAGRFAALWNLGKLNGSLLQDGATLPGFRGASRVSGSVLSASEQDKTISKHKRYQEGKGDVPVAITNNKEHDECVKNFTTVMFGISFQRMGTSCKNKSIPTLLKK